MRKSLIAPFIVLLAGLSSLALAAGGLQQTDTGLRLGDSNSIVAAINGDSGHSSASGLTATGNNQATAAPIVFAFSEFTTVSPGSGASLPLCLPGSRYTVANNGANPLLVYSALLETSPNLVGNSAGATGDPIPAGTSAAFYCPVTGHWYELDNINGSGSSINVFSVSLTPAQTAAAIQTVEQTFTVNGLTTADTVTVNGPAPTSLCPPTTARVSAANTLAIGFTTLTAVACTPAAGTYKIVAVH